MSRDFRNSMKSGKCLDLLPISDLINLSISRQYDNTSAMFMIATPSEYRSSTQETSKLILPSSQKLIDLKLNVNTLMNADKHYSKMLSRWRSNWPLQPIGNPLPLNTSTPFNIWDTGNMKKPSITFKSLLCNTSLNYTR